MLVFKLRRTGSLELLLLLLKPIRGLLRIITLVLLSMLSALIVIEIAQPCGEMYLLFQDVL